MVDNIINGMIAGIVGAVAYIAVKAVVGSNIYTCNQAANTDNGSWTTTNVAYNSSNATAGQLMIHDILPLAIAILVIAGLFLGLTKVRGV